MPLACPQCSYCGHERVTSELCDSCWSCTAYSPFSGKNKGVKCCECRVCPACKKNNGRGECRTCKKGVCCCTCKFCRACGAGYPTADDLCPTGCGICIRRCGGNCQCTIEAKQPPFKFQAFAVEFINPLRKDFIKNKINRFLSAEIEVASIKDTAAIMEYCNRTHTTTVYDGSIPKKTGFELTTQPKAGDKWIEHIQEICSILNKDGATIDGSCGLHIHTDARNITNLELIKIIKTYALVEPALYSIIPRIRRIPSPKYQQWYTQPFAGRAKDLLGDLTQLFKKEHIPNLMYGLEKPTQKSPYLHSRYKKHLDDSKKKKYNNNRYYGFNIHTYFYRGTLECRIHEGTTNPEEIINWGILFASIIEWGRNANYKDIMGKPIVALGSDWAKIHKWSENETSWSLLKTVMGNSTLQNFYEKRREAFWEPQLPPEPALPKKQNTPVRSYRMTSVDSWYPSYDDMIYSIRTQ